MRRFLLFVAMAFFLPTTVGFTPRAAAQDAEEMYEKLVPSVVGILVPIDERLVQFGAGVFIDDDKRLVLTSYTAVNELKKVGVTFPVFDKKGNQVTDLVKYLEIVDTKEGIVGEVIARNKKTNLALIRLSRSPPPGTKAVKIAEKSVGQAASVWGFGHVLYGSTDRKKKNGQLFNITEGKVRAVGEQEVIASDGTEENAIRVSGKTITMTNPLNGGDQGGPLFNAKGELVGIQHGPSEKAKAQLVSTAVDRDEIMQFLEDNKVTVKGTLTFEMKAAPEPVDAEALYTKSVRSAVFITTSSSQGDFSMGSGSLIDLERRLIITNYHVVGKDEWVHVQFPFFEKGQMVTDKKKYFDRIPQGLAIKGEVQYRDSSRDLAIVKLTKDPPAGTTALKLAAKPVRAGATVWNIGSPGAVNQVFSTTKGIVRCVGLQQYLVGGGDDDPFNINARILTVTLPLNPGDSGGPFINAKGELIGVGHAGVPRLNLFCKAIDLSEVKNFLAEKGYDIAGVSPITKKDPPKKENNPTLKTPDVSGDEKAAGDALRLAKLLSNNEEQRARYKDKLQEIAKKYPATVAGKEAKRLFDSLK